MDGVHGGDARGQAGQGVFRVVGGDDVGRECAQVGRCLPRGRRQRRRQANVVRGQVVEGETWPGVRPWGDAAAALDDVQIYIRPLRPALGQRDDDALYAAMRRSFVGEMGEEDETKAGHTAGRRKAMLAQTWQKL